MLRPANSKPTVIVTERGEIAPGTPRVSYRRGFADLLDFASAPARIAILSPDTPTAIGLARTGHAMREAMAAFGKPAACSCAVCGGPADFAVNRSPLRDAADRAAGFNAGADGSVDPNQCRDRGLRYKTGT